ncbi:hypothetical protein HDU86_007712 [Geranomyces michiganensis]|nr:hypothetical protein HDU86_007712 [Geranomyces michiganensis]
MPATEKFTTIKAALEHSPERSWETPVETVKAGRETVFAFSESTATRRVTKAKELNKLTALLKYEKIQRVKNLENTAWEGIRGIADTAHNQRELLAIGQGGLKRKRMISDDEGESESVNNDKDDAAIQSKRGLDEDDEEIVATSDMETEGENEEETGGESEGKGESEEMDSETESQGEDASESGSGSEGHLRVFLGGHHSVLGHSERTVEEFLKECRGKDKEVAAASWILHLDDHSIKKIIPKKSRVDLRHLWSEKSMAIYVMAKAKPGAHTADMPQDSKSAFAYLNALNALVPGMNGHQMYDHEVRLPITRGDETTLTHRRTAAAREMVISHLRQLTSGSVSHGEPEAAVMRRV